MSEPTTNPEKQKKNKKILFYSIAGTLGAFMLSALIYILVITGGRPLGQVSIDGLSARLDSVSQTANYAAGTADNVRSDFDGFLSYYVSQQRSDSTSIENIREQIKALQSRPSVLIDYKARKDIEKLKTVWKDNMDYIAKKDSLAEVNRQNFKAKMDSVSQAKTVIDNPVTAKKENKKFQLPVDNQAGDGQSPPDKKEKKKQYTPKSNRTGGYQNYNKAPKQ